MKIAVIAIMVAAVSGLTTWMMGKHQRDERPGQHRYLITQFEERLANGHETKSIFRIDASSGKIWRLNKMNLPAGAASDAAVETIEGWDEIPASFDEVFQKRMNARAATP